MKQDWLCRGCVYRAIGILKERFLDFLVDFLMENNGMAEWELMRKRHFMMDSTADTIHQQQ